MRFLTISEILELHEKIIESSGGSHGLRDLHALESALNQPHTSFDGQDLYLNLPTKAAALGHSLIMNHPFIDGNKRIGHAAIESFLMMNDHEISASVDEQEKTFLGVASGKISREDFIDWVNNKTIRI